MNLMSELQSPKSAQTQGAALLAQQLVQRLISALRFLSRALIGVANGFRNFSRSFPSHD